MTQPQTQPDVTTNAIGYVTTPDGRMGMLGLTLEYRVNRPLEIAVTFRQPSGREIGRADDTRGWVLDRETLSQGVKGSDLAGAGDVRVAAVAGNLLLHLEGDPSEEGNTKAVVRIPLEVVASFLARTYQLVPAGAENVWPGLDAELARLIDNNGEV